ncbi:MAG: hypothetical protein CVT49_04380 [candidate division Zixibacteria bacterium HGW-Zixibacteria-1]|nr:MAG: hypothetical protein CVT49_04380 [candidate division Zixibacteria bacterium HGW-Zixibacteria-1]
MDIIESRNLYCAYLDILGFSEIVKDWDRAKDLYLKFQKLIEKDLSLHRKTADIIDHLTDIDPEDRFKYFIISDSIILMDYNFRRLLQVIPTLTCDLIKEDIFIRGGLSFGKHYSRHSSENHLILSQSLTNAYIMEKSISYPICILDPNLYSRIKHLPITNTPNEVLDNWYYNRMLGTLVQCDDQNWAINPFLESSQQELDELKTVIEKKLSEYEKDKNIYLKYIWLYRLLIQWMNIPKLHNDAKNLTELPPKRIEIKKSDIIYNDSCPSFVFLLPEWQNNNGYVLSQLGRSFNQNIKILLDLKS